MSLIVAVHSSSFCCSPRGTRSLLFITLRADEGVRRERSIPLSLESVTRLQQLISKRTAPSVLRIKHERTIFIRVTPLRRFVSCLRDPVGK